MLNLWNLYWTGNASERIRPLRFLQRFDFSSENERKEWCKISTLIKEIGKITKHNESQRTKEIADMSLEERNQLFREAFASFTTSLYRQQIERDNRVSQLSRCTLYNSLCKKRKREEEEEKKEEE